MVVLDYFVETVICLLETYWFSMCAEKVVPGSRRHFLLEHFHFQISMGYERQTNCKPNMHVCIFVSIIFYKTHVSFLSMYANN